MAQGGHPQGAPNVTESRCIDHILRQSWLTWVRSFGKSKGKHWQLGFCDSGTEEWAQHLWVILQVFTQRSRGTEGKMPFQKCEDAEGGWSWQGSRLSYMDANVG